jgi:probable 2-oxoglutarate dehydrogenase E1 component DHKTD1
VVFVSGKLYYDLVKARGERGLTSRVAIVRVEELCPFPFEAIRAVVRSYGATNPNLSLAWVQEEARNQGAWPHVSPRLDAVMQGTGISSTRISYIGRRESEVPAVGVAKLHQAEVADLIESTFNLSPRNQK